MLAVIVGKRNGVVYNNQLSQVYKYVLMKKYITKFPDTSGNMAVTFEAGYKRKLQICVGAHRIWKVIGTSHGKSLRNRIAKRRHVGVVLGLNE